ncbi:MAG: 50S ribosomal protein L3 [Candidatus Levybacteria bacterium GW2011_GWA2_40_8]|nr:MAG: 50S ribosomal protein L3 [Candidatus Levybacteria bacterium GW2011_GWA2_40_8]
MLGIVGKKVNQTQKFLEDGTRIPVTQVNTGGNVVVSLKSLDKDKYSAVQIGFGIRKNFNKAILGHTKKAGMEKPSRFLREIRVIDAEAPLPEVGSTIKAEDVLKPGDIVDITGKSKGKGYAGVVKRHHFKGGPRTHGQSDRERAPGSIGQTTTPGRVYKGKRMAGRMGNATATLKNLMVVDVSGDNVFIKGLVPGALNSLVVIRKTGESKKFIPLWKEKIETDGQSLPEEKAEQVNAKQDEKPTEEDKSLQANEKEEKQPEEDEKAASLGSQTVSDEPKTADVENSGESRKEKSADAKALADKENAS